MEDSFQNQGQTSSAGTDSFPPQPKRFKFWIFLGGVFLFGAILSSFLYVRYKTADRLINLASVDTVLYASARDSIWPFNDYISDYPFSDFYQHLAEKYFSGIDFKNDLLGNSSRAAFILMLDEDFNLAPVFIFELKNRKAVEEILPALPYHLKLSRNVLAVGESQGALDKIREVKDGSIFSLTTQAGFQKKNRDLAYLYLRADNLRSHLNTTDFEPSKIFSYLTTNDVCLSFEKKKDRWQFKGQSDYPSKNSSGRPLVEYLPDDFGVYVSNLTLADIFQGWEEADSAYLENFSHFAESLKALYDFDLENRAIAFLNQPADLIIFNNQENESALGFDYIMVMPKFSSEEINNFEELVKIVLAQKLPQHVLYLLPDGTPVTELVAKTDFWEWEKKMIGDDFEISYLEEPILDFEISYLVKDDKIIVSNSVERVQDFLTATDLPLEHLKTPCKFKSLDLIINTDNLLSKFKIYLPEGIVFVSEEKNGFKGCVYNF